jgi:hypothetical protein
MKHVVAIALFVIALAFSTESPAGSTGTPGIVVLSQNQPGSAGGVVGDSPKSASGEETEIRSRRHRDGSSLGSGTASQLHRQCANIAGVWSWFGGTTTTINPGGSMQGSDGNSGSWQCSDDVYVLTWRDGGWVDRLILSENGTRLSGSNNWGVAVWGVRN